MKSIVITDFLTAEEIEQAIKLWNDPYRPTPYAKAVCEQIIRPNMERINKALGQENEPMYLAYAVEYVIGESSRRRA